MALTDMADFTFKHSDQADNPGWDGATGKANLDSQATQIRTHINGTLNAQLSSTADGASGADNVGATVIPGLGAADTVQEQLEAIAVMTTQGDITYQGASTPARLAKGTARQQLAMNAGATAPEWVASPQSLMTAKGDMLIASAANTPARLAIGTARQVLQTNAAGDAPEWAASPQSVLTAQGDIMYASSANTLARLAKGTARQGLAMNAGATAPEWQDTPQSLMTAKGDIIQASAANTPARLAIGTEGQSLVVLSTGLLGYSDRLVKNWVVDGGNFEIAQAVPTVSTDITNPADSSYPVFDKWQIGISADSGAFPTVKHSQELLTSGAIFGSEFYYNINVDGAGSGLGNNSRYNIMHPIEHGTRGFCGLNKTITVSFWARSTIANKKLGVCGVQTYGTGGSPSTGEFVNGSYATLTSDWTRYKVTLTTNTLVGKTFGTALNDVFYIYFGLQWGSSRAAYMGDSVAETFVGAGDIQIAQVQIDEGSVALPYQKRSYGENLAACQRYLKDLADHEMLRMTAYDANALYFTMPNFMGMRTKPTLINNSASETVDFTVYSLAIAFQSGFAITFNTTPMVVLTKTAHGLTDGYLYIATKGKLLADARF